MNKLISVIVLGLILGGCSSTREVVNTHEEKQEKIMEQVELAQIKKHGFCEGSKLFSYIETKYYYQFMCNDGRNFMIPKTK